VAVLRETLCGSILQEGGFAFNSGWQIYLWRRVAVLPITQGGTFTCTTRWLFYVYYRVAVLRVPPGGNFTCNGG